MESLLDVVANAASPIIGAECATSLFRQLNLSDVACVKILISKALSYAVVTGALVYKLPQILKIVKAKSVEGISLSSIIYETLSFSLLMVYSFQAGFPLSSFGEVAAGAVSDVIILYLFYLFGKEQFAGLLPNVLVIFIALFNAVGMMGAIPFSVLTALQPVAILIFVVCRIPQIWSNFKNKGTGQLAFLTVLAQFAGTLMRLITIIIEVDDPMILGSSLTAFALNSTIFVQFVYYWWANSGSETKKSKKLKKTKKED